MGSGRAADQAAAVTDAQESINVGDRDYRPLFPCNYGLRAH
jgi:hypothetical protein